jgi:hypothetical protein
VNKDIKESDKWTNQVTMFKILHRITDRSCSEMDWQTINNENHSVTIQELKYTSIRINISRHQAKME